MKHVYYFLAFVLVLSGVAAQSCNSLLSVTGESEALGLLRETDSIEATEECLNVAIKHNWWELAAKFANNLKARGVAFGPKALESVQTRKATVKRILDLYETRPIVETVSPAFQWAQSPNKIFLEIKYARKIDSPGCEKLRDKTVDIKEGSFRFYGICDSGNIHVTYDLNLDLAGEVDVE
jgi:hypothetical protein